MPAPSSVRPSRRSDPALEDLWRRRLQRFDQNIYAFRGTSNEYLVRFEGEYRARRLLLTENYRSTEPVIAAANNLIRNNRTRLKQKPEEQVRIDAARAGGPALPVRALRFASAASQAAWVAGQVRAWLDEGVPAGACARPAPRADDLSPGRLLLGQAGPPHSAPSPA